MKEAIIAGLKSLIPPLMAAIGAVAGSVYFTGPEATSTTQMDKNIVSAELCRQSGYTPIYHRVTDTTVCDVSKPLPVEDLKENQYVLVCTRSDNPNFPDDCAEQ